jgi:hypothetical protein
MSSAFFPLGMNSKQSSGYSQNSTTYNKQYITWKGTGINSNPVGTAPGHIRPLTNNDPGNVFQTGFGLPRPIKHYRKGRVIPAQQITGVPNLHGINENGLINYNMNRIVKSSKGSSLGEGAGGSSLIDEMQDKPGAFIIQQNPVNEVDGVQQMNLNCTTCEGVGIVANYYPNKSYLTENPEPNTTNTSFCCNEEYKAKRRAIYASTNLKKNYYTTTKQYLQNRCKTYDQKAFNFLPYGANQATPGSPLALTNTYLANCIPNTQYLDVCGNYFTTEGPANQLGCRLTVYKPSNYQYAVQGAVDSSTRNLKLTVDTITTNAATIKNTNLDKNKAPTCNTPWPLNFSQSGPYQNKKLCYYNTLPEYQIPASQQGSYRYYPTGNIFSSNHFSQSPNTYNTTTGSAAYN